MLIQKSNGFSLRCSIYKCSCAQLVYFQFQLLISYLHSRQFSPHRLMDSHVIQHTGKFEAILCIINAFW